MSTIYLQISHVIIKTVCSQHCACWWLALGYLSAGKAVITCMRLVLNALRSRFGMCVRADCRFVPSQWETSLQSNAVSHCLGANLESALYGQYITIACNVSEQCFVVLTNLIFQWIFNLIWGTILYSWETRYSLWPIDAIWRPRSGSTLTQVMPWCRQWASMTITLGQLHKRYLSHELLKFTWKLLI